MVGELRSWLDRVPKASALVLQDGTAAADEATLAWLSQEVRQGTEAVPSQGSPHAAEAPPDSPADLEAGLAFFKGQQISEGLRFFEQRLRTAGGGNAGFVLRLRLAQALTEAGRHALAWGLYLALEEAVQTHGLETWDPGLAAECLEGLLRLARVRDKDAPKTAEWQARYLRLARLAPSVALRTDGQ